MSTTAAYQPIGFIRPVTQVPNLLTSARPLPAVRVASAVAQAYDARLEAVLAHKNGDTLPDLEPHTAAIRSALADVGPDELIDLRDMALTTLESLSYAHLSAAGDGPIDRDALWGIADRSWGAGVSWNQINCAKATNQLFCTPAYVASGAGSPFGTGFRTAPVEEQSIGPVHTDPFTFYTPMSCDWTTVDGSTRLRDAARAMIEVNTPYAFGQALWKGAGLAADSEIPTLRRNAVDVTPTAGTAVTIDIAFAALLDAYEAKTGGSGGATLHVPSAAMVYALGGGQGGGTVARPEGNYYRGPLGSLVSPGPGYMHGASSQGATGNGPYVSGAADASAATNTEVYKGNALNEVWVFLTGPVEFAVSAPMVLPLDEAEARGFFRTNLYEVWAQRQGIVRYDPCSTFACLVTNPAGPVS